MSTTTHCSSSKPPRLDPTWLSWLSDVFETPAMHALSAFLRQEQAAGTTTYPANRHIFRALDCTPPDKVRVVILGQDPYHGPGQAHGLSFSVPHGVPPPPSLVNIFKEIQSDVGAQHHSGDLTPWTQQGVLLLNTVLTVQASLAHSHRDKGWETFTDTIITRLSDRTEHLVFMLWGRHAQKKSHLIDASRHLILRAAHPSPLSAHQGFLGCKHFSQANRYLQTHHQSTIDWSVPLHSHATVS